MYFRMRYKSNVTVITTYTLEHYYNTKIREYFRIRLRNSKSKIKNSFELSFRLHYIICYLKI